MLRKNRNLRRSQSVSQVNDISGDPFQFAGRLRSRDDCDGSSYNMQKPLQQRSRRRMSSISGGIRFLRKRLTVPELPPSPVERRVHLTAARGATGATHSLPGGNPAYRQTDRGSLLSDTSASSEDSSEFRPSSQYRGPRVCRARALVDYLPSPYDTEALPFRCGDIIDVISRSASGLWRGSLYGRVGTFKFINVEVLEEPGDGGEVEERLRVRPRTVEQLLHQLSLAEYHCIFSLHGFDRVEDFIGLRSHQLGDLGIDDPVHRRRLLTAARSLEITSLDSIADLDEDDTRDADFSQPLLSELIIGSDRLDVWKLSSVFHGREGAQPMLQSREKVKEEEWTPAGGSSDRINASGNNQRSEIKDLDKSSEHEKADVSEMVAQERNPANSVESSKICKVCLGRRGEESTFVTEPPPREPVAWKSTEVDDEPKDPEKVSGNKQLRSSETNPKTITSTSTRLVGSFAPDIPSIAPSASPAEPKLTSATLTAALENTEAASPTTLVSPILSEDTLSDDEVPPSRRDSLDSRVSSSESSLKVEIPVHTTDEFPASSETLNQFGVTHIPVEEAKITQVEFSEHSTPVSGAQHDQSGLVREPPPALRILKEGMQPVKHESGLSNSQSHVQVSENDKQSTNLNHLASDCMPVERVTSRKSSNVLVSVTSMSGHSTVNTENGRLRSGMLLNKSDTRRPSQSASMPSIQEFFTEYAQPKNIILVESDESSKVLTETINDKGGSSQSQSTSTSTVPFQIAAYKSQTKPRRLPCATLARESPRHNNFGNKQVLRKSVSVCEAESDRNKDDTVNEAPTPNVKFQLGASSSESHGSDNSKQSFLAARSIFETGHA